MDKQLANSVWRFMSKKEAIFYSIIAGLLMWSINNVFASIPVVIWWLLFGIALLLIFLGTGLFDLLLQEVIKIIKHLSNKYGK